MDEQHLSQLYALLVSPDVTTPPFNEFNKEVEARALAEKRVGLYSALGIAMLIAAVFTTMLMVGCLVYKDQKKSNDNGVR